jgi:hypothetical protein
LGIDLSFRDESQKGFEYKAGFYVMSSRWATKLAPEPASAYARSANRRTVMLPTYDAENASSFWAEQEYFTT